MTPPPKPKKHWFEQGEYPALIAQYQDLSSRSQGRWSYMRDSSGLEGILIADGAVWHFGCSGCPEMIRRGPTAPGDFLAAHAAEIAGHTMSSSYPRSWSDVTAMAYNKLLELGYTAT